MPRAPAPRLDDQCLPFAWPHRRTMSVAIAQHLVAAVVASMPRHSAGEALPAGSSWVHPIIQHGNRLQSVVLVLRRNRCCHPLSFHSTSRPSRAASFSTPLAASRRSTRPLAASRPCMSPHVPPPAPVTTATRPSKRISLPILLAGRCMCSSPQTGPADHAGSISIVARARDDGAHLGAIVAVLPRTRGRQLAEKWQNDYGNRQKSG